MTQLTDSTFQGKIDECKNLVIKLAATWCGPCKALSPLFVEITDHYSEDLEAAVVDIDDNPEIVQFFEVKSVPTMLFIKDGVVVKKITGMLPKSKLEKEFSDFIDLSS